MTTAAVVAKKKKLLTTGQLAYSTWFLIIGIVIWSAREAQFHTFRENLFRGSVICMLFLAGVGFNSAKRQPYTTAGTAPQFMRGIIMFYCCALILILSNNYEDARTIISVFEDKPS
jgi:hypothetical protein